MSIDIPNSATEVEARSKADVQRELLQSNPFGKNSWLGAIVTACAFRIFDFYIQLKAAINQSFPDTATGTYLTRWAAIWGKQLQAASKSSGNFVATGTATSTIPLSTVIAVSGVGNFISTSAATITANSVNINDLTRSGTTVTASLPANHGLASGVEVTIAGASNSEYNGTFPVTVTADDAFQYEIVGTPPNEIGTSATVDYTIATVPVESEDFGAGTNLSAGTNGTLQSPISGVDDTLIVDFGEIGGGTDLETENSLRSRTLDRIQNPVAQFNVSAIDEKAKEIPGVTRTFVQEPGDILEDLNISSITRSGNIATVTLGTAATDLQSRQMVNITGADQIEYNVTGAPILVESSTVFYFHVTGTPATPATGTLAGELAVPDGQAKVYFMRDNDPNPIPVGSEVTKVKNSILEIKPANTSDNDVIVEAPAGVAVDFTFTDLNPNTSTMQDAINANLRQFFDERTEIGVDIDEDAYRSAIFNTVDTITGDQVLTFTLSAPSGDVTIAPGEIGILGNTVYP